MPERRRSEECLQTARKDSLPSERRRSEGCSDGARTETLGRMLYPPVHSDATDGESIKREFEAWKRKPSPAVLGLPPRRPLRAAELQRKVQQILNKACPENVHKITEQLADVTVHDDDELAFTCGLIFKRALLDPHYSDTLANLLCGVNAVWQKVPSVTQAAEFISVREILTELCRAEFQALPASFEVSAAEPSEYDAEEFEFRTKERKDKMLAFMRLLGNLFLRNLLLPASIVAILQDLLHIHLIGHQPSELEIECACELLRAVGFALQEYAGGRYVSSTCFRLTRLLQAKNAQAMDAYSKRVQFMIRDVVDLRDAQWVHKAFKSIAKTKDEIRKDVNAELSATKRGEDGVIKAVAGKRPESVTATTMSGGTPPNSPAQAPVTPSSPSQSISSEHKSKGTTMSGGTPPNSPAQALVTPSSPSQSISSKRNSKGKFYICKYIKKGLTCENASCKFAHALEELVNYKTSLCQTYAATGTCVFADTCIFAHGEAELNMGVKKLHDGPHSQGCESLPSLLTQPKSSSEVTVRTKFEDTDMTRFGPDRLSFVTDETVSTKCSTESDVCESDASTDVSCFSSLVSDDGDTPSASIIGDADAADVQTGLTITEHKNMSGAGANVKRQVPRMGAKFVSAVALVSAAQLAALYLGY